MNGNKPGNNFADVLQNFDDEQLSTIFFMSQLPDLGQGKNSKVQANNSDICIHTCSSILDGTFYRGAHFWEAEIAAQLSCTSHAVF